MAIHSTSRPSLQGRVLVRIPATFTATGGLTVEKDNGVWTLSPDFSLLTELTALLEPGSKDIWVWDPVTDTYNVMTLAALGASLFIGSSTTSNTIGTGSFTFTTQAGKLWTVGGSVILSSDAAPTTNYLVGQVTAYSGTTLTINVPSGGNHGSGAHTDWTISLSGSQGAAGSSGAVGPSPAIGFTFSTTTTDSDPGAGVVRFNNATPASVTAIYFDNADADANTVTAWLDSFDDSTNTAKGTLTFTDETAPATKMIFAASGSVVDGTGYRKVTVSHVSGATLFTNARRLSVVFDRAGDKGADGAGVGDVVGPASSTTDALAVYSNTTGKLLKDSGILSQATTTAKGAAELATDAETVTGSDTTRVTTPSNISARLAAPGAIGGTTPAAAAFTTLSASGLITATGGQIAFPATAVPSANVNTLDDYEEGTWSPVLTFATAGDLSVSYTTQTGTYTKIGRMIVCSFQITTSAFTHSTASGNLQVTGLPFTPASANTQGALRWSGITQGANHTQINANVLTSPNRVEFRAFGSGQSVLSIAVAHAPTGGTVSLFATVVYEE